MKKVVAYYSRTGNTKFVAERIAEQLGADLCEVTDKKNRQGRLVFLTGGLAALREKLTDIEVSKPIEEYDLVIVGSPVWAGKIAPATRKLLVTNDFSEKFVAIFVTLGGNKPEKALANVKKSFKTKRLIGELGVSKPLEKQDETTMIVTEWCKQIQKSIG